jgi:hypothetical protein
MKKTDRPSAYRWLASKAGGAPEQWVQRDVSVWAAENLLSG